MAAQGSYLAAHGSHFAAQGSYLAAQGPYMAYMQYMQHLAGLAGIPGLRAQAQLGVILLGSAPTKQPNNKLLSITKQASNLQA